MIDVTQPIFLFDDRSKDPETIKIDEILFQTGEFILCKAKSFTACFPEDWNEPLLINIQTEQVLNTELWSWIATNQEEIVK